MYNMELAKKIKDKFVQTFNETPIMFRSPGRINLIGEHTDYNLGYVLPAAIDKVIFFAITPRKDHQCKLHSFDMNDFFESDLHEVKKSEKQWANYLLGVVEQLKKAGYNFSGFNCVFGGNIPIGAGLSSSAALEAGLAFALNRLFNLNIDGLSLVKMSQKAENEFVGVNCGIMDQYINIFGKGGNVLRLDCRSLEKEYFPFNFKNISIVLIDTKVSHSLANSEYNLRRNECSQGVNIIKTKYPEVQSLRDVNMDMLMEFRSKLDGVVFKRCKYVIEENDRLLQACNLLIDNDLESFGSLMNRTHEGLSKDYEVSCKELDFLVEALKDNPKVYGSRMMGGGFGGCTINLIEKDAVEKISRDVCGEYKNKFGLQALVYETQIGDGTSLMELNDEEN